MQCIKRLNDENTFRKKSRQTKLNESAKNQQIHWNSNTQTVGTAGQIKIELKWNWLKRTRDKSIKVSIPKLLTFNILAIQTEQMAIKAKKKSQKFIMRINIEERPKKLKSLKLLIPYDSNLVYEHLSWNSFVKSGFMLRNVSTKFTLKIQY